MKALLDAILFDIGGTLVEEASGATPVHDLHVRLLPGVAEDLAVLASEVPLAAITNTSVMREADVRRLLDGAGIGRHFDAVVTSVDVGVAKPDPTPLLAALDRIGVSDRGRVLFVGNAATDAAAAAAAGVAYTDVSNDDAGLLATVAAWIEERSSDALQQTINAIGLPDAAAAEQARERHLQLTKPPGSLGALEDVGIRLAAMAGTCPPPLPSPAAVAVFAGDHGVVSEGVTPWPQEVTAQMVANFCEGGAAINVLARLANARVVVVDVGVATPPLASALLLDRNVRRGTRNLRVEPAMAPAEALAALSVGADVARTLVDEGARCLVTGDMGIGNTTPSAAVIAAFTGAGPDAVTGRGTGIDDATLRLKQRVVGEAVARAARHDDPVHVLAEVGGLEIAAIAGFILGGASARVPVLLDGVIALAGAVAARALAPACVAWCIAGHRSVEPGATVALEWLGLQPLVDLGLRLGEGTGAALALPLVEAAVRVLREMATFDSAGVTDKER